MNTKLTLTIEQTLIEKAKEYAKAKGRSLSDIVENYFKAIVKDEIVVKTGTTPIAGSSIMIAFFVSLWEKVSFKIFMTSSCSIGYIYISNLSLSSFMNFF